MVDINDIWDDEEDMNNMIKNMLRTETPHERYYRLHVLKNRQAVGEPSEFIFKKDIDKS